MNNHPKVSLVCITYNQKKFIRQTLESFVTQKTDFNFEVLIADDSSSDGTQEIIKEYAKSYPHIVKPIFRKKNLGPWDNFIDTLQAATGDYIALCEGDDYWTDTKKLRKQVNFLEKNKDFAFCFHPVKVFFENEEEKDYIAPKVNKDHQFTLKELVKANFIYTNSVMYRRQKYNNLPRNIMPADWYLHLYHAQFGKIGFINDVMSVYRRHSEGLWWDSYANIDAIWIKHGDEHFNLYVEILDLFRKDNILKKIIYQSIFDAFDTFMRIDEKHKTDLLQKVIKLHPVEATAYMHYTKQEFDTMTESNKLEVDKLCNELKQSAQHATQLAKENATIKSSKTWRLENAITKRRHKI